MPEELVGMGAPVPLLARAHVGRGREVEALHEAWEAGGRLHVVSGPAGIGKSRLVRELTAWAVGRGGIVLVGRATASAQATPLRPIKEALLGASRRGVRPGEELAPFASTLAAVVPEWGTVDGAVAESSLLLGEAVLRLLASLAGEGSATLVIEDLQWADPETLEVVEYLADNVADWPVLLMATLRDGESGAGTDLAGALIQRRVATGLTLGPLSGDAVVEVAQSCLSDDDLPEGAAEALVARSEGIPFLVEELVATAVDAGWDTVAAAIPGSVVASVEVRLDRLPPEARSLLVAAALLGRSFDWPVAAAAAELDEHAAAGLLRQAVRAQLVDVEGSGFRFRHALTRDAVLAATPPAEIELMARRALDAIADGSALDEANLDTERCLVGAELAQRAGRVEDAARLLVRAARLAMADGALGSADAFAARAGAMVGDASATSSLSDEVDLVQLRVAVLAGHTERATQLGEALLARASSSEAEVRLLVGSAHLAAGRWDVAQAHADAVAALVPDQSPDHVAVRARADALAAHAAMGRDDVDVAVDRASAALEGARATAQAEVQCEALEVLGRAERGRDVRAAEAAFQEAHDTAAAAGLALWHVRALQELGTIDMFDTLETGRLLEARREAVTLGAMATVAVVDLQLAATYDERGELDLALAAALRCEEASRHWRLSTLAMSLGAQGMVHARRGDRAAMDRAVEAAIATGEDPDYVEASVWGNVTPIYHVVIGDLAAAAQGLDRGMDVIRRRPAVALPYPGLWALLRTLVGDGDAARVEVAGLPFDTPMSRAMLGASEAVAAGQRGDVAAADELFVEADAELARQGGMRHPMVRLLVAPAAHRDGWGEPEPWLRQALAFFESMDLDALAARARAELRTLGVAVPRRSRSTTAGGVPPVLAAMSITAREAEVLALVARGATNREVADRLFISQRTVDKHVERLLQKTGSTRSGLAAIARDAGLLRT